MGQRFIKIFFFILTIQGPEVTKKALGNLVGTKEFNYYMTNFELIRSGSPIKFYSIT